MEDKELLVDFVIEAREHLADVENKFLAIEQGGGEVNVDLVNEVFRAIHSIKGAAGFLGLTRVNDLAHNLENLLNMMRNRELAPNSVIVDAMLRATDTLRNMILNVETSNDVDVSAHVNELSALAEGDNAPAEVAEPASFEQDEVASEEIDSEVADATSVEVQPEPVYVAPPVAAPVAAAATQTATPVAKVVEQAPQPQGEANIRVAVGVLDSLMNLAGELVLGRNQLLQAVSSTERTGLEATAARLDQITSELQEAIMKTRMQPIGSVFSRFPRVVRDLSGRLGKQCELEIEGKDVEVDKTIVEAIGDPLTHLVRNSIDHGIEMPDQRVKAGKPAAGTLSLKACYQAGKVRIEITDDGAGISPERLRQKAISKGLITAERAEQMSDREAVRLIFAPGFSTAAEVTDISGRGVGMDVVRSNITKLGGTVDVESEVGKGTSILITLPLTLAIIPSLIVQVGADRFAIPQVNISELVRVREVERAKRLGRVKDAEVLRLRGTLLPLVRLATALNLPCQHESTDGATNIIVVDTGQSRFGVVVDGLHDSEEIVVKPLGRHLKNCGCLAGATILGDGHVALILDIPGIAIQQDIHTHEDAENRREEEEKQANALTDTHSVLLFRNNPREKFAVPMDVVARIERVRVSDIQQLGDREVLQYKDTTMPLLRVESHIKCAAPDPQDRVYVVVYLVADREVGLVAPILEDIREVPTDVDTVTFREQGLIGSQVIGGQATRLLDLYKIAELGYPEWFVGAGHPNEDAEEHPPTILLAEDSGFFRSQVKKMFEEKGYIVEDCEDGLEAWEKLASGDYHIDVIVTDIEMPNMNGFELCRRVKDDATLRTIPVIALTSLAGSSDIQHGLEVGIDDYQIKMDREKLLRSLQNFVDHSKQAATHRKHKKQSTPNTPNTRQMTVTHS